MTAEVEVEARVRKDGYGLEIDCPGCGEVHLHGWGLGSRAAHCSTYDKYGRQRERTIDGYNLVTSDDAVAATNTDALERLSRARQRNGYAAAFAAADRIAADIRKR